MNMHNFLGQDSYHQNLMKVAEASKHTFNDVPKKSVETICNGYAEKGVKPNDEGVLDIGVSFDRSWRKGATHHIMEWPI